MLDCGNGLNCSSTVAESGLFPGDPMVLFVGIPDELGYQLTPRFTPIQHKYNTIDLRLCRGPTVVAPS